MGIYKGLAIPIPYCISARMLTSALFSPIPELKPTLKLKLSSDSATTS